jgi:hypothetical protein
MDSTLTVRRAAPADDAAITRVSSLDSARPPVGPTLVAELNDEIVAAVSLRDGAVVADPFRPTTAIVEMLRLRRRQLTRPQGAARRGLAVRRVFVPRGARA